LRDFLEFAAVCLRRQNTPPMGGGRWIAEKHGIVAARLLFFSPQKPMLDSVLRNRSKRQ
jgi:hypothetical protein